MTAPPLVVDLDGTLLRSDLLLESGFAYVRAHPLRAFFPLRWLARGKAHLKDRLARDTAIDVASLPYDPEVIRMLEEERAKGRQIILATASPRDYAERIAAHLQLFDRVLASQGNLNLSAGNKRDALVREFGEGGFDYAGNSRDDLPVWAAARRAYVVNPDLGVEARARAWGNVERVIRPSADSWRTWARALRLHQWAKNLLVFVPLLAAHRLGDPGLLLDGGLAFLFFGLCASSVYLLNDLLDLPHDRRHPTKRLRPFACGELSIKSGFLAFPALLVLAFAGALWLLPWRFAAVLAIYYGLTLAYSLVLKQAMVLDAITLAVLYTLRIIAGAMAYGVALTFWILAFAVFIFLSLAFIKRYAELRASRRAGETEQARGRGYYPGDLEMISTLGAASGYLSVMVLALYIQDAATVALYRRPEVIWAACLLLLFWINWAWLLAHRGQMEDDPVVFAIKDRVSLVVGGLFGAVFWLAA